MARELFGNRLSAFESIGEFLQAVDDVLAERSHGHSCSAIWNR